MAAAAGAAVWLALQGGGGDGAFRPGSERNPVVAQSTADAPERLAVRVISERPHDPAAFTQGLVMDRGRMFESTGLRGRSTVREVDPTTGEVLRLARLPDEHFGEGLGMRGDELVQLTWRSNVAHVWSVEPFAVLRTFQYGGEGWGLCYDGARWIMSDGSDRLSFRDGDSFERVGSVSVTLRGRPRDRLNELECVDGLVWANVWQRDDIVAIDPTSGRVVKWLDASPLSARIAETDPDGPVDVLNGIAFDEITGTWLLTGKLWPRMFEVEMVSPATATALATPVVASPSPTATAPGTVIATPTETRAVAPARLYLPVTITPRRGASDG